MDIQQSVKHRSLGTDTELVQRTKRPPLGGRHKSAPLAPQIRSKQILSTAHQSRSKQTNLSQSSDQIASSEGRHGGSPRINLAVMGHARVGKSTFTRHALNLDKDSHKVISSSKVSFDGQYFRVQLFEVGLDTIKFTDKQSLKWPESVNSSPTSSVHGVLFLYDITNENSIEDVPQTLHALCKSRLPVLLIASKSDAPMTEQEVGIAFIERIRSLYPTVNFAESSSKSPQSSKRCLTAILKATLASCDFDELSLNVSDKDDLKDEADIINIHTTENERTYIVPTDLQSVDSDPDTALEVECPDTPGSNHDLGTARASVEEGHDDSSKTPGLSQNPMNPSIVSLSQFEHRSGFLSLPNLTRNNIVEGGTLFTDLVDRLLQMPATKNETKFVPAFLCLYRAFATPKQLLKAVIDRYVLTAESDLVPLAKVGESLRHLQVLAQWTAHYPGDFAASSTRKLAMSFARDLEHNSNFAPTAKEIVGNLLTVIMDDDQDWAYEDKEEQDEFVLGKSATYAFSLGRSDNPQDDSDNSEDDKDLRRQSFRNSGSASTTSSIVRSSVTSSQSATNLFNLENAREQSRLLKSVPHITLTKVQWHHFMSTPTEELAREITRMDWTMFSAIRARDFVRHVSLSSEQRARLKHGDIIGMMVKHFNHLALFVSGMTLFRDKPKHRARILEKFMDLAWKVRQLNNYNSLGAIVAGITGPEISRLSSTNELIPAEVQKQFLRLTILMSHSRSYAAYRMAWENSFNERIPFIPLVRQDLTLAASANPTFIGKNVNWKKFEIMGDVIVGIHRSHEQPYHFHERTQKSQEITKLILETKVINEPEDSADPRSELFDRSVLLEPHISNEARKSLVGFGVKRSMTGWFQN